MESNIATRMRWPGASLGLRLGLFAAFINIPAGASARITQAEWKQALHQSQVLRHEASTTTGRAPNSVPAWKIAETKPGYGASVAAAPLPPTTSLILQRERYVWSVNPTRFDSLHPHLGAIFQEEKQILAGVPASSLHGLLPNTPAINYYRWRRSLDPARFDSNHPNLGPLLAQDQIVRNLPIPAAETITPPPSGGTGTPGGGTGGGGNPPAGGGGGGGPAVAVPEPGAMVLLLIGTCLLATPAVRKKFTTRI